MADGLLDGWDYSGATNPMLYPQGNPYGYTPAPAGYASGVPRLAEQATPLSWWDKARSAVNLDLALGRNIASGLWDLGPGTIDRIFSGELQPGTPEFNRAATNTALAYGPLGLGMLPTRPEGATLGAGGRPRRPFDWFVEPDVPPSLEPPPPMGDNRPPGAPFPQYAESYPEVGTPVPAIDKKTGNPYLEKGWTPEMKAFQKARAGIVKDMRQQGYDPYYDVSQRENVDPQYYPPNVDTTTIVPKKQTTIDLHMANIGSDEARARLQTAYQTGLGLPNTQNWYAMKQLEDDFIKELGPVEGRNAFRDRFATSMAATTGGANPESNFLMAMYGNYLRNQGLPYPEGAYEMPFPIGGRYAMGNMEQHQKIFDAGGFAALGAGNPKRHDFAQSFMGNPNVATMDEQMTSGMTPGINVPPEGRYGLYTGVTAEEAAKAGVLPRDFQDVAWAGFKNLKDPNKFTSGQPMISVVNDAIERTHRLTGMSREEIVRRGIIRGEIPIYGLLGAVGAGAAAGTIAGQ